jgi:hypothetical protein
MNKSLRQLKKSLDNLALYYNEIPYYGGCVMSQVKDNKLDLEIARRIEVALKKKGVVVK